MAYDDAPDAAPDNTPAKPGLRYSDDDILKKLPSLLRLDRSTGKLYWRERPDLGWWNTRYAGREAFITPDSGAGYLEGRIGGRKYLAHRVVWALAHGSWPAGQIDHVNHDRHDNRPDNLRCVSARANSRNRSLAANNTSGVNGVCWNKDRKKWQVNIRVDGRCKHLGFFASLDDAREARASADRRFGYHENHGKAAA